MNSQDRVKDTALAFCASLLQTTTPGASASGGSAESMWVPPGTLHESSALDDMLDGVAAAKDRMEAAKAKIQQAWSCLAKVSQPCLFLRPYSQCILLRVKMSFAYR